MKIVKCFTDATIRAKGREKRKRIYEEKKVRLKIINLLFPFSLAVPPVYALLPVPLKLVKKREGVRTRIKEGKKRMKEKRTRREVKG